MQAVKRVMILQAIKRVMILQAVKRAMILQAVKRAMILHYRLTLLWFLSGDHRVQSVQKNHHSRKQNYDWPTG